MKKFVVILLFLIINIPAQAFQDYVVIGDGKLTNISIGNHEIIDVFPLITVMNDKSTLFVQPLKVGKTNFSVLKDKKKIITFEVEVTENKTTISNFNGFDSFILDEPNIDNIVQKKDNVEEDDYDFLDLPPEEIGR